MTRRPDPLPVDACDLWLEVRGETSGQRRPALFVDRDGTLIQEVDFLHEPERVSLIPGAPAALAAAHAAGWLVVIVTNQSGIGRGLFGWREFAAVQKALMRALEAEGAAVDMVVACAHHPQGIGRFAHPEHPARKPRAGMLLSAAERLPVDLSRSVIVGDRATDLAAGRAAGLAAGFLVRTGYGVAQSESALALQDEGFSVRLLPSIAAWRPSPPS